MGCTVGKPQNKSKNNQLDATDIKKKHSNPNCNLHCSQSSYQGCSSGNNNSCVQEFGLCRNKKRTLQVDYINDPNQSDQITAKITRNSPNILKKRSFDPENWSPNMDKLKLQNLKQQSVEVVQEKSEFEEQGTNHDLYKVNQNLKSFSKQTSLILENNNQNITKIQEITVEI